MRHYTICIVTAGRSDYGLLHPLLDAIVAHNRLLMELVVTGNHLSNKFGSTYKEIVKDGFKIDYKVKTYFGLDSKVGVAHSIGAGVKGFSDVFEVMEPDLIILLGDRYEVFSAATAGFVMGIPIAHIHGGEVTFGSDDDTYRHCITKLSTLHFVATDKYKKRVVQLGESPEKVFTVGGLGVEVISKLKLLTKIEIEKKLGIKFLDRNLLITLHPSEDSLDESLKNFSILLDVLNKLTNTLLIFTYPNCDKNSLSIIKMLDEFVMKNKNSVVFKSLGVMSYLSCVNYVDGVVGNSSSGLLEVPSFKKGTINIGDRQKGRVRADSVIDCKFNYEEISDAINMLYANDFKNTLDKVKNPYDHGCTSSSILKEVVKYLCQESSMTKKEFYDIKN